MCILRLAVESNPCGLQSPRGVDAQTRRPWFWARFPLFRHIWMRDSHGSAPGVGDQNMSSSAGADVGEGEGAASVASSSSYLVRLQSRPDAPPQEREAIVLEAVRAKVAKHLGLEDAADVDVDALSMSQTFGIDSLGVVELRGFMRTELDIVLEVWGILDLIERKSIRQFCQVVATKVGREVS